jgi:pyrroline-5-carboxylate reductase
MTTEQAQATSAARPGRRGRLAILGAGTMGETLLVGMLRAGWRLDDILLTARQPARRRALAQAYGVPVVTNREAARLADTLLLAVKPQDMDSLLADISPVPPRRQRLVLSIVAGIGTATIEAALPPGTPVLRVMTNTAIAVNQAMTVISAGQHATEEHLRHAEALLRPFGPTLRVDERHQDTVTAISGSGPAYFFYLAECIIEAGVKMGLSPEAAAALVIQTAIGAATMLRHQNDGPAQLRASVTSPGGTTARAIGELAGRDVPAAVEAAVLAARERARELGRTHGRPIPES